MVWIVRGVLILAVAVAFWNWLVGDAQSPDWIRNAKSKPALDMLAAKLESYLPGGGELESSLDRDQRRLLAMIDGNVILKFRPDARPI